MTCFPTQPPVDGPLVVVGKSVVGKSVVGKPVTVLLGPLVMGKPVTVLFGANVVGTVVGAEVGAVVGAVVGAPVVGAAVDEKLQSQVPDSSPTAAIANLFSLITLALSSVALPVIIPCKVATGELKMLALLLYPVFE